MKIDAVLLRIEFQQKIFERQILSDAWRSTSSSAQTDLDFKNSSVIESEDLHQPLSLSFTRHRDDRTKFVTFSLEQYYGDVSKTRRQRIRLIDLFCLRHTWQ